MTHDLKKLLVAIPVVESPHGAPVIRVSDFASHYDELVLSILPAEGWLVLTSHGVPVCEVHRTTKFARIAFRKALPSRGSKTRTGVEQHDGALYVQKSDYNARRTRVLQEAFNKRGADNVTITYRGWPDCELRPPQSRDPVTHKPVIEPLPGQRGVQEDGDENE